MIDVCPFADWQPISANMGGPMLPAPVAAPPVSYYRIAAILAALHLVV